MHACVCVQIFAFARKSVCLATEVSFYLYVSLSVFLYFRVDMRAHDSYPPHLVQHAPSLHCSLSDLESTLPLLPAFARVQLHLRHPQSFQHQISWKNVIHRVNSSGAFPSAESFILKIYNEASISQWCAAHTQPKRCTPDGTNHLICRYATARLSESKPVSLLCSTSSPTTRPFFKEMLRGELPSAKISRVGCKTKIWN